MTAIYQIVVLIAIGKRELKVSVASIVVYSNLATQTFKLVSRGGLAWLESARLSKLPWLVHAFSTRRGGLSQPPCAGLNLGFTESDQRERVERNRRRFFAQLGGKDFALVSVRQIHSSHSFVVTRDSVGQLAYRLPGIEAPRPSFHSSPSRRRADDGRAWRTSEHSSR